MMFTLFSLFENLGCLESKGVELYGVHRDSNITIEEKPYNCIDPKQENASDIFFISYNCLVSLVVYQMMLSAQAH